MDIEEDEDQEEMVEAVLEKMWRYCQTYSIGNAGSVEDRQPHWYVMDEFGSRVPHGHMPTYRLVSLSLGTSNQPVCYNMIHRFVIRCCTVARKILISHNKFCYPTFFCNQ